jgi:1-acyl-sn-glycerol-3-phosphate acyltransferase
MDDWQYKPAADHGLPLADQLKSIRREPGLIGNTANLLWVSGLRWYLRLYHRLQVEGRENLPTAPPFVLCANHASHLDALILASALPRRLSGCVFPIAAGDVFFETPARSAFAALCINALPMWRKNCGPHALRDLRNRLVDEPCGYILFPEGARSRDGRMLPFKPGLGMILAGLRVPVVPCYLEGAFEALRPETRWPRPLRITLRIGNPLDPSGVRNRRDGWEEIVTALRAAIDHLRTPP